MNILLQPFTDTICHLYFCFIILLLQMIIWYIIFIFVIEHFVRFIKINILFSLPFDMLISMAARVVLRSFAASFTYKKLIFCMNHPSLERIFCKHILHKKKAPAWFATADPENIYRGELCSFPRNDAFSARISSIISHVSPASMHDVISEREEQKSGARRECEGWKVKREKRTSVEKTAAEGGEKGWTRGGGPRGD